MMKISKDDFFKRQTTLTEIGKEGQQKLQKTSVLIVGCGGLGNPIAVNLALSGIGKIHVVDFDLVDKTNLHRQTFFTTKDIGKSKAKILAKTIKKRAPFTKVKHSKIAINKSNVVELISKVDFVVDATDSLPTKYLLNDVCVLKNKPLIYGSLYKFNGYVASFNIAENDGSFSANLRDAFPEMTSDIPNCSEVGTLNSIVGIIAMMQVNEVLKLATGIGKPLKNELLIYDSLQNSQLKIKLTSLDTNHSDRHKRISEIFKTETYKDANCEVQNSDWIISAKELKIALSKKEKPTIISVSEKLTAPFKIDEVTQIQQLKSNDFNIDFSKTTVLVCEKGISSYIATKIIKEKHPSATVLSLQGGVEKY